MTTQNDTKQPWLGTALIDLVFILSPPFLCLLFIFLFPSLFKDGAVMPAYWWVIIVLLIDVAHVYSTLYRTYLDKSIPSFQKYLLKVIPIVGFILGVVAYRIDSLLFWSILAYVAVFHFIRQQYGIMRLYSRKEIVPAWMKAVDIFTIYYATIYPLLFWHFNEDRNFNWFVDGDFIHLDSLLLLTIAKVTYLLMLGVFLLKETMLVVRFRCLNIPRLMVLIGTIASWYFGIVYFNGDMAFTLLNVVSHGIPYMALIWIYAKRQSLRAESGKWLPFFFKKYGLLFFLAFIFLLAYLEEALWDLTVWKEHTNIFGFLHLSKVELNDNILCFLVPLLALPQITHYIIDGFIWKKKEIKPSKMS